MTPTQTEDAKLEDIKTCLSEFRLHKADGFEAFLTTDWVGRYQDILEHVLSAAIDTRAQPDRIEALLERWPDGWGWKLQKKPGGDYVFWVDNPAKADIIGFTGPTPAAAIRAAIGKAEGK